MSAERTPEDDADVCVIGSGPGGALVAADLAARGYSVVILEAGRWFDPDERHVQMELALRNGYDGLEVWEMGGERDEYLTLEYDVPLNTERVKGVGGTTLHWGAVTPRLHEEDFEMETRYGLARDWPLEYDDLRPYYAAAERELGVSGDEDNPFAPPRSEPYPMEGFPASQADSVYARGCEDVGVRMHTAPHAIASEPYDGRSPCQGYGTCIPVCPSGAKYSADVHVRKAEADGARVIDRAQVHRLEHDSTGETLERAHYTTPDGTEYEQAADAFVVACGAIETPRLLLLSASDAHPDGLANSSGQVGRNLMGHPYVTTVAALEERTRQNEIGFTTSISHEFYDHEEVPTSFQFEFSNVAEYAPMEIVSFTEEWGDDLFEPFDTHYGQVGSIVTAVEQLPDPDNRVTLAGSRTDNHGRPIPMVDWHLGERELETAAFAQEVAADILTAIDGEVVWQSDPETVGMGAHHMGTTRMGTDPDESVVSPELRAHDLENLYISSASTFVTGGAVNPTLTIAALALKVADHVDGRL
ncbi:GMC family oxidoreductase [Natronobiforma cellulositropha]|uniref:GMC family oxidoreductase n=1 Tax=Natronobiforma cellulositropha TaxID=1679076 RepID=UPI0021D599EF|nr:GMC family oxidoreductase [Natronobiforma cellulositropha]